MRRISAILLFLIILPSCGTENGNSFHLRNQFTSAENKIIKSYINYLEAINHSSLPLLSYQAKSDPGKDTILIKSFQSYKDLQYIPASLWQLYSIDGAMEWKSLAENLNEIIQLPQFAYKPGNGELIRNAFLTPYQITGEDSYCKILIESLNQQISASEFICDPAGNIIDGTKIGFEKLLENELLFFAFRETGDPVYQELALEQSEQIYQLYFRNNLSNEVFFGLANGNTLPGTDVLKELSSEDLNRLAQSFYGFTILANEVVDEKYSNLVSNHARLFASIYGKKSLNIRNQMDLSSRIIVCLAMSKMKDGCEINKDSITESILKSVLDDLEMLPGAEDRQYSFRMYYYLFECLKHT